MPIPLRDDYRYDPRRFFVATERLAIYSGVYTKGDVITDFQAGSAAPHLVAQGILVPMDYDLRSLTSHPNGIPEAM
ncbi:hypothetical protein EON82_13070 [bacterium]|nr:MAG: hypothetical protein EON82_13070 [bacterium]